MSLTRQVAYNTFTQTLGKAINTALALITIAALTRYLGVAGFGNYTTIWAFVAFFGVFADFGFFWILLRELSRGKIPSNKVFNNTITLRLFLALFVYLGAFLLGFLFNYPPIVKTGIGVIAAAMFFQTMNSTVVAVFQSKLRMDRAVFSETAGRAVILGLVYLFISLKYSLLGVLTAYLLGNTVNFLVSFSQLFYYLKPRLEFDFALWKKIARAALPMGIVLALGVVYYKIDTLMLSWMKTQEAVGIYGASYKILEVLQTMPTFFLGPVFPILTRYLEAKSEKLEHVFQRAFDFLVVSAPGIVAGVLVLSPQIIGLVAGDTFVSASTVSFRGFPINSVMVLQILSFSVGINFFSNLFIYMMIGLGRQKDLIIPNIVFVALNIILNLFWIPRYSYLGASVSTLITEMAVIGVTLFLVFRQTTLLPKLRLLPKSFLAALGMGVVLYQLQNLNLFTLLLLGGVVYVLLLYLFKAITKEDLKLIFHK